MRNSLGLTLKEWGRGYLLTSEAPAPEIEFQVFNMEWLWFPGDQYTGASLFDTASGNISPSTTANGYNIWSVIMFGSNSTVTLTYDGIVGTPFLQCRIGGLQFAAIDSNRTEVNNDTVFTWDWSDAVSGTQDIFGVAGEGGLVDTFEIQETS